MGNQPHNKSKNAQEKNAQDVNSEQTDNQAGAVATAEAAAATPEVVLLPSLRDLMEGLETRNIASFGPIALGPDPKDDNREGILITRSEKSLPIAAVAEAIRLVAHESFSTVVKTAGKLVASVTIEVWGHDVVAEASDVGKAKRDADQNWATKGDFKLLCVAKAGIGYDPKTPNDDSYVVNFDGSSDLHRAADGKFSDPMRAATRRLEDRAKSIIALGSGETMVSSAIAEVTKYIRTWDNAPSNRAEAAASGAANKAGAPRTDRRTRGRQSLEVLAGK